MKLYYSNPSPFARKARICLYEAGLEDRVEQVAVDPWADPEGFRDLNPFGRVPTLELDDGSSLFQSNVVCEYFDGLSQSANLFPVEQNRRFRALRLLGLSDNLLDCCIVQRMEQRFHPDDRADQLFDRQSYSIDLALDKLEAEVRTWPGDVDIGTIAIAVALDYHTFRFPELDWRPARNNLVSWHREFITRPSMMNTEFTD